MSIDISSRTRVTKGLEELTGYPHAVYVQSGTAALEVALRTFGEPGARVALPAFSCWTVPFAVHKVGMVPVPCDLDEHWGVRASDARAHIELAVDPWGGVSDWATASAAPVRLLDAAQSPGALVGGRPAAEHFDAAIVSFGAGKPIDVGAGGAALFRDEATAREARRLLRFGVVDGRWMERVDRYVFPRALFAPLSEAMDRATFALARHREEAIELREHAAAGGVGSNPLRRHSLPGLWGALPIVLPPALLLDADEVARAALASGVGLVRHPVSVGYREPAWPEGAPAGPCPRAETLHGRVLFAERRRGRPPKLRPIFELLDKLAAEPEAFRVPYALPPASGVLPPELAHWSRDGAVCRAVDGGLWVHDRSTARVVQVPPRAAALVQDMEVHRRDRAPRAS